MIPCANPKAHYLRHQADIQAAISRVLESGCYILGPEVEAFEREFALWQGVGNCITVGNGTDALVLALKALDIGPGDEVITVSHTAVATVAAIQVAGATPVLVDITPSTYTMNPEAFQAAITSRSKAVIPVHLYGHPADMISIITIAEQYGLKVIEDCAQAHGAKLNGRKVGTFGHAACFSFYPTKNLGALGDGGAVTTDDTQLADKLRLLKQYGWREKFISEIPGWNSRLDELQAAVLRVRLSGLDRDNDRRREIAEIYSSAFNGFDILLPDPKPGVDHVYHLYVIRVGMRDKILTRLRERDIGAAVHYPQAVHQQPAYRSMEFHLPETESVVKAILTLPLYPEMSDQEVYTVVDAMGVILSSH